MCTTCGCSSGNVNIDGHDAALEHEHMLGDGTRYRHTHVPSHPYTPIGDNRRTPDAGTKSTVAVTHEPLHGHAPGIPVARMVQIEQDILAKNNQYAVENRVRLADRGIFALNLVSSPGSGKTTLLCKTISRLLSRTSVAVIEGDQQTSQDAERVRATGASAVQINTGKGCHLDARMVGQAMSRLPLDETSVLMIENVGNLVCPASFDLGEAHKVVILSVTEGEDKPIKYPDMFRAATLMLLNKCDLLPYLEFDVEAAIAFARQVNPRIEVIQISATHGEGMDEWLSWIERGVELSQRTRRSFIA